jgi:nitrogen fixation/metabolism regulation signal transduction histidine kinase
MEAIEETQEKEIPASETLEQPKPYTKIPFRRRKFLIDRRGQLLATAKIAGVVLVLLVLLNVVFWLWSAIETQAIVVSNPQLLEEMESIDRRASLTLAVVSLLVLLVVVVRAIVLTHRTAGAAFNLQRCLDRVASGDYGAVLRMRAKDNLRYLQDPFNQMTQSLRSRAAEHHDSLAALATKIEELGHADLAEEVRTLAEAKTQPANPMS